MPLATKEAQREYQRIWMRNRREEFFKDKVCSECGSREKLVLHHVDKSRKKDHKIWSWRKDRRERELKKCIVLCDKCHCELHAAEQRKFIHGTATAYRHYKCRCDECKKI